MAKSHLKLVPPATENRTVAPLRRKNADLRTSEHLTPAEVEKRWQPSRATTKGTATSPCQARPVHSAPVKLGRSGLLPPFGSRVGTDDPAARAHDPRPECRHLDCPTWGRTLTMRGRSNSEAVQDLMTIDDFRHIALAMPGAEELNGMGYPNFRAGRRSFATIEDAVALIRLTRDQQAKFVETAPEMFAPATDGWGKWGSTIVRLEAADEATLWDALATAWRNVTGVAIDPFKVGDADNVNDAVDNLAGIDAKNAPHVVATDVANGPGINVADVNNVELADNLESVIERLRAYWGSGPAM